MELREAIAKRKSVRAFLPRPVARETLEEIIGLALRAPSAMNTQPWRLSVVSGQPLAAIKKENMERLASHRPPGRELPVFQGVYRNRQVDLAKQLFGLMGIEREDRDARQAWMARGFRQFDAPAAIVVGHEKSIGPRMALSDLGGLIQTICLLCQEAGLGTCINDQGLMYPDVVYEQAGVSREIELFLMIAVGWPDWDFPANRLETPRAGLEECVRFVGF